MIMESSEKIEAADKEKEPQKYNFESIAEFEKDFISLVEKLKKEIEEKPYEILFSDDVGGRIPTLALGEVIKQTSKQTPEIYFLPAADLSKPDKNKRSLLVTEHVVSGLGMKDLNNM